MSSVTVTTLHISGCSAAIQKQKQPPVIVAVLQEDEISIFGHHGIKALGSGARGGSANSIVNDLNFRILLPEPIRDWSNPAGHAGILAVGGRYAATHECYRNWLPAPHLVGDLGEAGQVTQGECWVG